MVRGGLKILVEADVDEPSANISLDALSWIFFRKIIEQEKLGVLGHQLFDLGLERLTGSRNTDLPPVRPHETKTRYGHIERIQDYRDPLSCARIKLFKRV